MKKLTLTTIISFFFIACSSAPDPVLEIVKEIEAPQETVIQSTGCDTKMVTTSMDPDSIKVALAGMNKMGFEVREQSLDLEKKTILFVMVNNMICNIEAQKIALRESQGLPTIESKVFASYNEIKMISKIRKFESAGWEEVSVDEQLIQECNDKTKEAVFGTKQVEECKSVKKYTVVMERKMKAGI
jgi:hypothetical protein